jgi:hypothetical protein
MNPLTSFVFVYRSVCSSSFVVTARSAAFSMYAQNTQFLLGTAELTLTEAG